MISLEALCDYVLYKLTLTSQYFCSQYFCSLHMSGMAKYHRDHSEPFSMVMGLCPPRRVK